MANTPAARAGVQRDDVIVAVNETAVSGPEELRAAVRKAGAGSDVTLRVARGKEMKELKAHLGAVPPVAPPAIRELPGPRSTLERRIEALEKRVKALEQQLKDRPKPE